MSVEKVLAISGKPGLYELKLQTRSGFIAESLIDGKKITVGLKSNVSLLSEISIYTQTGEVKLFEIFARMAKKENNGEALSHKANEADLVAYFSEIVPNYDVDRVYVSDIKKVFNWYNIIQKAGMAEQLNATPAAEATEVKEEVTEAAPAKKTAKPKKEKAEASKDAEEKPKAKRTAKAKKEE